MRSVAVGAGIAVVATALVAQPTSARPEGGGGPTVRWVPEPFAPVGVERPVADHDGREFQLLPRASGVYEVRPPFLVDRPGGSAEPPVLGGARRPPGR